MRKRSVVGIFVGSVLLIAGPAWAQTVTWVTPPPATAPSGGTFTVQWQVSGFTGPFISNDVAWGQISVLGQAPGAAIGGDVYEATVTVPLIHGPMSVIAFAEAGTSGLILSPLAIVDVSLFEAVAQLQELVSQLQTGMVPNLGTYVQVGTLNGQPVVRVTGANLQVVDGTGSTDTIPPNGLGNLIVGYDEPNTSLTPICSNGAYSDQVACEAAEATWGTSHKTGSHNLIVGQEHNYSSYGGTVLGFRNSSTRENATVTGGEANVARGLRASVSGGVFNTASGEVASVGGGTNNTASALFASVTGGGNNTAGFDGASVGGGADNAASGDYASVSGGLRNTASNSHSSVTGGADNTASGPTASVSGGGQNVAANAQASVSGGAGRVAPGADDWVAGGLFQDN